MVLLIFVEGQNEYAKKNNSTNVKLKFGMYFEYIFVII